MLIALKGKQGNGKFATIDDSERERVAIFSWYVDSKGYAYREHSGIKRIFMHQFIMGDYPKDKPEIDHKNADKLDNRHENLAFCTSSENRANRRKYRNNKSGYQGVQWHKQGKKWMARVYINKISYYLGLFSDIEDAVKEVAKSKRLHKQ